ncbi:MAG TPA: DUF4340 domain-containing protein [Candidatus Baltobacteraceae bacterium]|jgi:hypothetical protein|nr:DUF4340 domain-containing protein [Candidatus Baltobacteraceae bacterium]
MNWKPTWVLLTAAAVVFVFIVLVEHPIRQERLRQANHRVLPGLDPATVTNIEIQPWGRPAIHAQRAGPGGRAWHLTEPILYPAQSDRIEALLDNLAKLEWKDRITDQELRDRPDAQEQFGFTQPQFSILLQSAGTDRRLEVGELSPMSDQVFLNVVGSTAICLAGADLLQLIPQDKNQWRDVSFLNAGIPFDQLAARSEGRELDLRRDATNHLWYMTHPEQARADSGKINDLLEQLRLLHVSAFISDDPQADLEAFGLQFPPQTPDLTLVLSNGAALAAVLEIGASPTNLPTLAYARRQDPSNVVLLARAPFRPWRADYTNFLDQHLISLSPGWIESIETHGLDDFSVRKATNGQWEVHARQNFPADATLMVEWLAALTNISTAIEKTVVADFSEYGLGHPALRYSIQFGPEAGGHATAHLEFGTNQSGRVFERRTDEDFVNTIGRDEFDRLPQASWQMRDRSVWSFESSNVISVTIHQLGATRKYLRDPDGNWTFAPGYHGPPLINSPSFEEGVYRIGELTAIYWDGIGDDSLQRFGFAQADFNLEFQVKRPKGTETLRIDFGGRSPYTHPYASVVRDGQRLIFEFPADLYENYVEPDLTIPAALRYHP